MSNNCAPDNFVINFIITVNHPISHADNKFLGGNIQSWIQFLNPAHGFTYNFKFTLNSSPKHLICKIDVKVALTFKIFLNRFNGFIYIKQILLYFSFHKVKSWFD